MEHFILESTGLPDFLPMERSEGIHVSDVIYSLCVSLGYYRPTNDDTIDKTRMDLGRALEHAFCEMLILDDPQRYMRIGELCLDDISGNLDLYDILKSRPKEIKLTWRSARHDINGPKFWGNRIQAICYAKMLGCTSTELDICHVDGNYEKDFSQRKVIFNNWICDMSSKTVNGVWDMIRRHADTMRKKG